MPRPRRPGAPEPKRRSRKGCWPCKARKVKCGEEKPSCLNCRRQREPCDYSIRLNWEGRTKRNPSIDSPSSLLSCQSGGFLLSLPVSPPAPVQPANSSARDKTFDFNAEYVFVNTQLPDSVPPGLSAGDLRKSTDSAHPEFLDHFLGHNAISEAVTSPHQMQDMIIPWLDQSPQSGQPTTESIGPTSLPYLDNVHHSPVDGLDLGPLSAFSSANDLMSRPVSFCRHSIERSKRSVDDFLSEDDVLAAHDPKRLQFSLPADTHILTQDNSPQASTELGDSPHPSKMSLSPSYNSKDNVLLPRHSLGDHGSSLKVTSGPLALDNYLYNSYRPMESQFGQAEAGDGAKSTSAERKWHVYLTSVTDNYGLDRGRPDLDLNKNDDHAAIDINYALDLISSQWKTQRESKSGDAEFEWNEHDFDPSSHSYYVSPVPINIPRYLSPLPSTLLENPINLMYFHHFLNHTAKMLVPHDCDDNPFVSVLPSMAIVDFNLLNLMLAYSASHRARYLEHPEPSLRIAHWVSNVFPALRIALDDPHEKITDSHLATAVMLLSLKIISPSTFEVPITWQSHLKLARGLFLSRSDQIAYPGSRIGAFIARWLGYIDIMGTLSCRRSEPPLHSYHDVMAVCSGALDWYCVDCFTGFTPWTGVFLTRLGALVHKCDNEQFDEIGNFLPDWKPSSDAVLEAESLIADLDEARIHAHASGQHYQDPGSTEFIAVDEAFRYAGLLHLHRRVLCTPPSTSAVKEAVDKLTGALERIGWDTPAEIGVLFPLFTAGCETQDQQKRMEIMDRFKSLEKTGMKQIQNARRLMQRCWDEELPWIALTEGEFLG